MVTAELWLLVIDGGFLGRRDRRTRVMSVDLNADPEKGRATGVRMVS